MSARDFIDLSMPISAEMPTNEPDHFPPTITPYATIPEDGWTGSEIRIDSHCGTHVDGPSHFVKGAAGVDTVPLEVLIGPAQRLNVVGVRGSISATDLPDLRAARVILHTGWSDEEGPRASQTPHLDASAARALLDAGVRLVGIDTPSVDAPGVDAVHQSLLRENVVIVENLAATGGLPDSFDLIVTPLRIVDGDGSPARAIAVVERAS